MGILVLFYGIPQWDVFTLLQFITSKNSRVNFQIKQLNLSVLIILILEDMALKPGPKRIADSTGKPDRRQRDNKETPGNTPSLKPPVKKKGK
jgi:hypothetical protein